MSLIRQLVFAWILILKFYDHDGVVDINILYDGDHECSPEAINMSNKGINDDAVYLIAFGLHYNTVVKKLDVSYNHITDNGAIAIGNCLKANDALQELNLSKVRITDKGLKNITEAIQENKTLQKLDLSYNHISNDEMIRDCLKEKNTLKELNLSQGRIQNFLRGGSEHRGVSLKQGSGGRVFCYYNTKIMLIVRYRAYLSKYKEIFNQIWSRGCGGCNPLEDIGYFII